MILQSDNGGEFISNIIKFVMPKLGIKLINGSPYSPTSQGQIERFNKTLKNLLKKEIQIEMSKSNTIRVENWPWDLLPKVMDLYIHHKHRSFVESCSRPNPDEIISNKEMYIVQSN